MTSGGREVDVGGEGPIFKYIRTKLESEFLTGQDEYSFNHAIKGLESENTVERLNGWSCALFWQLGRSPPTSTSRPPTSFT